MDPEATLKAAEESMDCRQYHDAIGYITDYNNWRTRGGWEPEDGDLRAKAIGGYCRKRNYPFA